MATNNQSIIMKNEEKIPLIGGSLYDSSIDDGFKFTELAPTPRTSSTLVKESINRPATIQEQNYATQSSKLERKASFDDIIAKLKDNIATDSMKVEELEKKVEFKEQYSTELGVLLKLKQRLYELMQKEKILDSEISDSINELKKYVNLPESGSKNHS